MNYVKLINCSIKVRSAVHEHVHEYIVFEPREYKIVRIGNYDYRVRRTKTR